MFTAKAEPNPPEPKPQPALPVEKSEKPETLTQRVYKITEKKENK